MSRRSPRQTAAFSLFTFLDVMLCTLGALIIVLICVVRTAQQKNADEPPQNASEVEEIESERETLEWRAKHLASSREQTRAQLQDRRLELSHIEEHSRRLRKQLAELEVAKSAEAKEHGSGDKLEQLRAEAKRVSELADAAERDLEKARLEADSRRPSYAVVPYEGPSQTLRRPLYIECTADRIILQPENIELSPFDFAGPMGPGNPLAAGLRAAREYLTSYENRNSEDAGEPYPLLLVRPDGVEAYYQAREGMTSWGSEFGYELIDQDWKLEFRPPQPAMVEAMRLAVDEARLRQQALARAAPRAFNDKKSQQWYRASPSGGIVQDSGPGDDSSTPSRSPWSGRHGGGGHRGGGGGYATQGSGGRSNMGGGTGRGSGAGRYANNGGGRGGDSDSTGSGNSEQDLASVYGAAASAQIGSSVVGGSSNGYAPGAAGGTLPGGAPPGTGYGTQAGGINPGGNGAGTNMLAGGQNPASGAGANMLASGTGPGAALNGGSSFAGGTANGPELGMPGGGGDSLSGYGSGTGAQTPTSYPLPSGANGDPSVSSTAAARGKPGDPIGGFGSSTFGSGAVTELGATTAQGSGDQKGTVAGGASSGVATNGAKSSAMAGGANGANANGAAAGATAGAEAGSSGPPGGQESGQADGSEQAGGQQGPAGQGYSKKYAQGRPGQQGPGKLGMQPGAQQNAGGGAGQPGNPGGQAGLVSANAAGGQSSPMGAMPSIPSAQFGATEQTATNSMADRRGKNWSLPEEARHAVPITRPVRVECRADRLVLPNDDNPAQPLEIPLDKYTEDSVEDLVSSVWKRVETWGSAGRGMYWRPQLAVDVAPGAEGRYKDLQTLLTDSGIEVKPATKAPAQVARPKRKMGPW